MFRKIISVFIAAIITSILFTACETGVGNSTSTVTHNLASEEPLQENQSSSSLSSSSQVQASSVVDTGNSALSDKAYEDYAANNYDGCVNLCDQALAKDPNCAWAYNMKGIALYFANGNSYASKCLDLINKSITIDPNYYYGYFNKALILKGLKQYDEAISNFNKVIALKQDDTWSYYGIATCYADTDQVDLAFQYLKLASNLDPSGIKAQAKDDIHRHFEKIKDDPRFLALIN